MIVTAQTNAHYFLRTTKGGLPSPLTLASERSPNSVQRPTLASYRTLLSSKSQRLIVKARTNARHCLLRHECLLLNATQCFHHR